MTRPLPAFASLLILAASALLAAVPAMAETDDSDDPDLDRTELAEQIHSKVQQLHDARRQTRNMREDHQAQRDRLDHDIERLRHDQRQLRRSVDQSRAEVRELQSKLDALHAEHQALESALAEAIAPLGPLVQRLATRLQTSTPSQREQWSASLEQIQQHLAADAPEQHYEAARQLLTRAGQQIGDAGTIELINAPITLPKERQLHAYRIRLGLLNEAFVSEDGRAIGLADPTSDRDWRLDLDPLPQRRIQRSLDILRQQHPPQITPVPFLLPTERKEP